MDSDSPQLRAARREAQLKMAMALADLAVCAWMLWTLIPEHQRKYLQMSLARRIRLASLRAAASAGRNGMVLELTAGRRSAGRLWYEAAYQIMRHGALRAERLYERIRSS